MHIHFAMWGNSLALRIPKALAETIAVDATSTAIVTVEDGALVVRPAAPVYRIEDLVKGITPKNRHAEIDWGGVLVGEEVI